VQDENPELRKVARALPNFVKGIVPGVKETVMPGECRLLKRRILFVSSWSAKIT